MNKTELVKAIADRTNMSQADAIKTLTALKRAWARWARYRGPRRAAALRAATALNWAMVDRAKAASQGSREAAWSAILPAIRAIEAQAGRTW